ncbi:MAG: 2-dehydropantoate 2-reductase N-terminal domain-containing protein [Dehalococcoidia bacterium]
MRYVIYGAGAVGCTIGGRLAEAGHKVVLVARGEHAQDLRARGLTLLRPDGDSTIHLETHVALDDVGIRDDDVVIMSMQTQHFADAIQTLTKFAPSNVAVVCAQNGLESQRIALRMFPNTYAMCVMLPANYLEPGVVRAFGAPCSGVLDLGRYPEGVDEVAVTVAADLDGAGFSSRPVENPMRIKRGKLIINLHNALEALAGRGVRDTELPKLARREAYAVFEAAGLDVATPAEDAERRKGHLEERAVADGRRRGGSSWQSLARSTGSIETDYLNGEIVLHGRLHGVATPVNYAIQLEARRAVAEGREAGSMRIDDLRELVLQAVNRNQ